MVFTLLLQYDLYFIAPIWSLLYCPSMVFTLLPQYGLYFIAPIWSLLYCPNMVFTLFPQYGLYFIAPVWSLLYCPNMVFTLLPQYDLYFIAPIWSLLYCPNMVFTLLPQYGLYFIAPIWSLLYCPSMVFTLLPQYGLYFIAPIWSLLYCPNMVFTLLPQYGLGKSSLRLLMEYLISRKQRTKVGSSYSKCSEIKHGTPQGSILELLLFNIFINDLLFVIEKSDVRKFADGNILCSCGANLQPVLENLKHYASIRFYWFKINSMKANPEKFQFMILSKKSYQPQKLSVNTFTIDESDEVE